MRAQTRALALAVSVLFEPAAGLGQSLAASPRSNSPITPLPQASGGDVRKIDLGRSLFFDYRLSRSGTLRCASCHDLTSNGATAARTDLGDSGHHVRFNTPTIFNSAYSFRLGWEGRARTLQELTMGTLKTEHLMSGGGIAAGRLKADPRITARFRAIYGRPPEEADIADVLAAFVGTLVTPDAPFDRWLRGDHAALDAQQVRGYDRFKALGCVSCHQGTNVGANLFQRRGIFHPLGEAYPKYIRVPSLRNVTVTTPYFHDGSVSSLAEAIRRMARAQLDLTIADRDVRDIEAFLDALTGSYQGRPLHAAATVKPR